MDIDAVNIIAIVILILFTMNKRISWGFRWCYQSFALGNPTQPNWWSVWKNLSLLLIGLAENIFLRGKLEWSACFSTSRQLLPNVSRAFSWNTCVIKQSHFVDILTNGYFPAVFLHISTFDICHDKYKYKISWVGQSTRWTPALMGIAPGWPQSFTNLVVLHIFFSLLLIYQICRNYPSWISLLSSPDCSKWRSLAFGPHPSLQSACSSYS